MLLSPARCHFSILIQCCQAWGHWQIIVRCWDKRALQERLFYRHHLICNVAPLFDHVSRSLRLKMLMSLSVILKSGLWCCTVCREVRTSETSGSKTSESVELILKLCIVSNRKLAEEVLKFLSSPTILSKDYEKCIQKFQSFITVTAIKVKDKWKFFLYESRKSFFFYKKWWSWRSFSLLKGHYRASQGRKFSCKRSSGHASTIRGWLAYSSCSIHKVF